MTPRLRAPQQDEAILAVPPLAQLAAQVRANQQTAAHIHVSMAHRPLAEIRELARREALAAARQYLAESGQSCPPVRSSSPFVVAGHQPELFHPGVWVKNFALQGLARQVDGVALNLVVDNDTAKSAILHLPTRSADGWRRGRLSYDHWESEQPYEERPVHDEALFADFADRVRAATADWPFRPLLDDFWQEVRRHAPRTPLLGERFAAARRTLEQSWGCHNLEVPLSRLCRGEAFAWFAVHLLVELPRLHAIYNHCVRAYRQANGIRSRNHPVPDLATVDDWLEAPLWAWRSGAGRRGRLLVRATAAGLQLRVGDDAWPSLPGAGARAVAAFRQLEADGFKLRSRALTTTLFARFCLADLFLHGIGGARYDELTDAMAEQFFGTTPPPYAALSATLLLPFPPVAVQPEDRRQLVRLVRDLRYNPQRHLGPAAAADARVRELAQQKQEWIAREPADHAGRKDRFAALRTVTDELHNWISAAETAALRDLAAVQQHLAERAVLNRRDHAFCLFPEDRLRRFCTRFLDWPPRQS